MIKLNSLLLDENDEKTKNFLLEKGFNLNFTFKKKLYYSLLRPILPIKARQALQEFYNSNIKLKQNFINDDFVKYLKADLNFDNIIKTFYPNNYSCCVILTHDVEEQDGFDYIPKIIELEEKHGVKSSWNIVPYKYKIDKGIINLVQNAGHEIGIHGYNHDGKLYYSEKIFNERVPYINKAIKEYKAVGFRSPQVHRNLEWLQKLDIKYDASCFDYDPFQPFPGGTGSIWPFRAGKFVELPYTIPQDHTLYYVLKQNNIEIWKNKINWLIKNKGIILSITHPDYLREKTLFKMYEELLEYIKGIENAWFCLPKEMTEWWTERKYTHISA